MKKAALLLVSALATTTHAAPAAPARPSVVKRVVISLARPSGTCVTTTGADGTIEVALAVLENGRGPKVDAQLTLDADGTIASLSAKGHHTFGAKVDETFTRAGGVARWKSEEESGERRVDGKAFFVPISEVPETLGLLTRALVAAGGTLPLLPSGEARLAKDGELTVGNGKETRRLTGYSIAGLDLLPTHTWMNPDGSWFGFVSPWFSVVPEGWDAAIAPIIAEQNRLDRARDQALARAQAHVPPAAGLAYTHARVLDVDKGAWLPDRTVLIAGGVIRAVAPSAAAKLPAGVETIDLAGKALLPGLWDMHAHLGDADGVLDIASGVTTARDVGNDPDKLDDYKQRYDEGKAIGPHVLRFGFIEGRGPKAASSKVTAETAAEARAAVAGFVGRGYDGIKIYNSVKPELVPVLAREAHAHGLAVTGHIPVHMLAHEAVRDGYDGIEHVNMLFLNFFATHDTDTRDTTRFTLVGDKAAGFDLHSRPVAELVALLKAHHTVIDPTVNAFEDLLVGQQGKITAGLEDTIARLPVQTQRGYLQGGLPLGDKQELYRKSFAQLLAMVKLLVDEKVTVVAGTDALAGLFLHHELALMARAGIAPADVLRAATIVPARTMKLDGKRGSIAVGKAADLVIVDGDPLARIADLARVVATVRDGVVYASAPLYRSLGVRPAAE